MPQLKVGDEVKWESQARRGFIPYHHMGRIYQVVPGGEYPSTKYYCFRNNGVDTVRSGLDYSSGFPNHTVMFTGHPRNHESYLVEVEMKYWLADGTEKVCLKLYWPRVAKLKRCIQTEK